MRLERVWADRGLDGCKRMQKNMQRNTIIRLGCIEEDTEFKYKRFRNRGLEQKKILENNGGAIKQHKVWVNT